MRSALAGLKEENCEIRSLILNNKENNMINERPALVVLQTTSENNMEHLSYNVGQKSWDKFTFVALFHTRQTNSHARIIDTCSAPPPPISLECWKHVTAITIEFQHCIGGWGGGGKQPILQRITVLF